MFGFSFGRQNDSDDDHMNSKHDLERFFEDEDWDVGQKGGEVEKDQEIDWSHYDFMHTFDDLSEKKIDDDPEDGVT